MYFTEAEEKHILSRSGVRDIMGLDQVRAKYQEPTRHYHDWNHALSVLSWVNDAADVHHLHWSTRQEMAIAALFHDVIYTIQGSPGNEQDSVKFLRATLGAHEQAERIILATAQHGKIESKDVPFETALFMDCDIASFGESRWEIVCWNEQNIVKEFLQKFTSEQIAVGRKAFLGGLLGKRSIFLTTYFQDLFEIMARRNIQKLIDEMI